MIFTSILILIVAKALPSINRNLSPTYFTRISSIIFIYAGVLSLNTLYIQSIGSGIGIYSGFFQITQVSVLIESFLLIIGSIILVSWGMEKPQSQPHSHMAGLARGGQNDLLQPRTPLVQIKGTSSLASTNYSLIVLFSSLGSCLLISSFDLISLYISIELQSFGLYVLATLFRDSESSTKAGLKYFLLGGLSSCIILLGCGIIYSYTGLTNFESIYSIISTSNSLIYFDLSTTYQSGVELLNHVGPQPSHMGLQASLSGGGGLSSSLPLTRPEVSAAAGLSLGLILIFIGFLFKIAAAPLHNWSPDVYDEVPTIVTIWLTIIPKISILILLLELQSYGFTLGLELPSSFSDILFAVSSGSDVGVQVELASLTSEITSSQSNVNSILKTLLLISSFLSLIIGTVVGLAQTRIKRLLAYSTISHIGFILLALGVNSESSIDSLLFYIIQYTITNLNIFLIIIALSYVKNKFTNGSTSESLFEDIRYLSEFKGKFNSNPILSISLALCLFSMAGIPPLIGFFSKQFVLYSALQNGYYFISIIAILVSVISASYYLKIVKILYTEAEKDSDVLMDKDLVLENSNSSLLINSNLTDSVAIKNIEITSAPELSNLHSYIISVLTLSILFFIFKPSLILNSTQLLSLSLFNW